MLSKQNLVTLLSWLCLGFPFFVTAIWYWDDLTSASWPTTLGEVDSRESTPIFWIPRHRVLPTRHGETQFRVNYHYLLDGKSQSGHTDWDLAPSQARKAMQDWKSGDALGDTTPTFKDGKVVVYCHPQFANISTIAPSSCLESHVDALVLFGFTFLLGAGSVIFYSIRGVKDPIPPRDLGSAVSQGGDQTFSEALFHASRGEDKKAIDCFNIFINYASKAGPGVDSFRIVNVAKSYLRRGEIFHKQGKYQEAVSDFDKAIALFETNQPQNEGLIEADKARAQAAQKLGSNVTRQA